MAGRKISGKTKKEKISARIESHRLDHLIKKFGSTQKAIDSLVKYYFEAINFKD